MIVTLSEFLLLYLVCVFLGQRYIINRYIGYALKPENEKKLRENVGWKEWLLYSRFRSIIPNGFLYPYYFYLLFYPLGFIVCLCVAAFLPEYYSEIMKLYFSVAGIDIAHVVTILFLFVYVMKGKIPARNGINGLNINEKE